MRQETWIQIISILVIVGLALFYNPLKVSVEGKIIFFGIILMIVLFLIVFDVYRKIETNEKRVKLFNEKINIHERLSKVEERMKIFLPKNKKGQIDPRILLVIIIIVLIYLYIKSQQG